MKTTLTKRIVSLLAVVALLMTMFTGMVFSVSADDTVTETYTMQDNSNLSYDKDGTNKEIFTVTNFGADVILAKDKGWANHAYGGTVYSDATKYPYGKIVVVNRNRWRDSSVSHYNLLTTNTVMDLSNGFKFKALGQSAEYYDPNALNRTGWEITVGDFSVVLNTPAKGSVTLTFMRDGVALADSIVLPANNDYSANDVRYADRTGIEANANINIDTTTGNEIVGDEVTNPFSSFTFLFEPSITYDATAKTVTLALDGAEGVKSSARPETKKIVVENVEPSEFASVAPTISGGMNYGLVNLFEAQLDVVKSAQQASLEKAFSEQDIDTRNNKAILVNSLKDPSVKFYAFDNADVGNYETLVAYSEESAALVDVTKGFSFATPIMVNAWTNTVNNAYKVNFGTFYVEVSYAVANAATVNVCKADGTVISTKTYDVSKTKHHCMSNLKNEGFDYQSVASTITGKVTGGMQRFELGISGDANGNITVFGGVPTSFNYWVNNDLADKTQGAYYPKSEVITTFNATEKNVADYTVPVTEVKSQWTGAVLPTPEFTAVAAGSDDDTSSEDVSSDATSSEDVSSDATSSEDVSSDATSSDDTSSGEVVETTTRFLPFEDIDAEKLKWTGRGLERIATEDVVINGKTYALRGSVVNQVSSNGLRPMTTNDTYDFGKKIKVNSTLVIYTFSDTSPASAYIRVGDFKFEIGDDLTNYYFRAYMGNEKVYEKLYESNGEHTLFHQVKLNAVIDTETKNVTLEHTYGALSDAQDKYNHSANYTGDYSFDGVTCEAQAQNNYIRNETLNGEKTVNVAVVDFYVTKYEVQKPVEVTVTVNAKNGREYSYVANGYPTIEGMLAADTEIKGAIQDVPGYNLTGWTTADGAAVETKVALTEDITLVPVYTKKVETYAVSIDTVVNNYQFNTYVTAVSDNAEFTSWTENSKVVSYAKEYSFFVGCDRTLTSVNSGAVAAQAVLAVNNVWTDGNYDYVLTEWALPEGCTLVAEGVIMTKDASVDLTAKTLADVDGTTIRVASTRLTSSAGQYLLYTNTNANFEAKAYLTYSDGTNQYTIYTDAVTVA